VTAGTAGTETDAAESAAVDVPAVADQLEISIDPPARPAASPLPLKTPLPVRRHKLLRQWPLVLVIGVIGIGLIVIAMHHFRWGSLAIASATLGAAFLRLVLPARRAGWLAVRGRLLDVAMTGSIGIALMVLALITKT
jgi:Protein of unknown function (DUF3017)